MVVARCDRGARRGAGWPSRALGGALALATTIALSGCGVDPIVVVPVIDLPVPADAEARADDLDKITVAVDDARSGRTLQSRDFLRGEVIELSGLSFGDDLVLHMLGYKSERNLAYGRTCAFAVASGGPPTPPHLFFSRNVRFATMDLALLPRIGGPGIAYRGAALLIGGKDGAVGSSSPIIDVERFDPLTGVLTKRGTVEPRDGAIQALVGTSPRVVVIGGAAGSEGARFVEVIDDDGNIEKVDVATMARVDLTATSLTDGRVIVVGGNPPGQPPVKDIDEIAATDDSLKVRRLAATLAIARSGHSATRLGDDVGESVLIAGGVDASGTPIETAELFKPLREEIAPTFAPKMKVPRHHHTAMLMPDSSVLIIGGLDAAGQPVRTLELFSVDGGFNPVGDLPMDAGLVEFAATTLPDGRILLTGGRAMPGSKPLDTAYIASLNLLDGLVDVVETDRMAIPRANHQALVLCDGTVLVTGGNPDELVAERYNPIPFGRR